MSNPYENDFADFRDPGDELAEQEAEHFSPCGCGDPRCRIDGNDSTNVNVKGTWFNADCVGLCFFCGDVDDLSKLIRVSGSWLAHDGCAAKTPVIADDLYRALHADEQRDDCNEVKR